MEMTESGHRKVFILGLDGVPYSFIKNLIEEKKLPNFEKLFQYGSHSPLKSILPTVSGVAWTSICTGKNPAKFGVFGFLDLKKDYNPYIPNATSLKCDTILDILSREGKRVISIGVPMTYPPREVNGILVGGFLTPKLEKGVYPKSFLQLLSDEKYLIDINPMMARKSVDDLMEDLINVFEGRKNTMFRLLREENWDFFITHFIETDRINHFMWTYQFDNDATKYKDFFFDFYQKIDKMIGEILEKIDDNTVLIILSDHGFCKTEKEIELNFWLKENGYLKFKAEKPKSFKDIDEDSQAFSLTPGRIYIHTENWAQGKVCDDECQRLKEEIIKKLKQEIDPNTNLQIFKEIYKRDEIFTGDCIIDAPDIIILPHDGYDLKAKLDAIEFINPPTMPGIHTYEDAMIIFNREFKLKEDITILDVFPTVLDLLGVIFPENLCGSSIIQD